LKSAPERSLSGSTDLSHYLDSVPNPRWSGRLGCCDEGSAGYQKGSACESNFWLGNFLIFADPSEERRP